MSDDFFRSNAWLIPLFPLAGFLFNGLAGSRVPKKLVSLVGCGVILASLLLALGSIAEVGHHPTEQFEKAWSWIPGFDLTTHGGEQARFTADWGILLDPLSAVMLFVVCFVGFFIHVYSTGYMSHEPGYWRFFAYLNLFMAMMLTLVLANNLLMMFVGWEGVGLCSYLLIGFYYTRKSAADAGKKAFVVNRVGDFGFALGVLFCLYFFGTVRFTELVPMAQSMHEAGALPSFTAFGATIALPTLICLLLLLGATGKSAQIPLFVWLPDAMEGPTPVSALIHAATMVTSGVYMIARLNGLFVLAPAAMAVVAVVGAATALMAATIAITQNDIKRVLAYSTVSQLGYMFLALGLGAFGAAVFHLMTHAFFKACLFLGSGSVIHVMSGEQDMRRMGGLRKHIPHTYRTFLIASVAIAGIPPLAGFFSKDEILWNAFGYGRTLLWGVGFATAGLTAFYMFRLVYMTFFQSERFGEDVRHHLHESPATMTAPLWVLAIGSIAAGWVGIPAAMGHPLGIPNLWERWLEPVIGEVPGHQPLFGHGMELALAVVSAAWAALAIGLATRVFRQETDIPKRAAAAFGPLYRGSLNKWYVDEIYDALVVNPIKKLSAVMDLFDRWVIDGIVNLVRHVTVGVSWISKHFDLKVVDLLVNLVGWTVRGSGALVRQFQTGQLQTYATYFIFGLFAMVAFYLLTVSGAGISTNRRSAAAPRQERTSMGNWYNPAGLDASGVPILSVITYLPAIGALLIMFLMRKEQTRAIKIAANLIALVDFVLSVPLYFAFQSSSADYQFVEKFNWFTTAGGSMEVGYHFGLDGISLLLFLLTTLLGVVAVLSSWGAIEERVEEYYVFILLLQTGMLGVFCALDFVLFYVFWEVMLVPMYFLIGVWGGPRKLYAAIKFFLYTLAGSVLMLLGILAIFFHHAEHHAAETLGLAAHAAYSFDIPTLTTFLQATPLAAGPGFWYGIQGLVFLAFFIGFAIKVPMFPFHTWLPDAHVEAPTAGSVILAGVLLKMGTYGFIRFSLPMFPDATLHFLPMMALLAIIGIVYGALVAMKQDDMKKLVAYSSVSHLGFCMLGMFALNQNGILGSMLQMINHGLSTGALFLIVGVVYERRHTRQIGEFGGLSKVMPVYAVIFAIATMSSIGLPALNGFIGEFTLLVGVFARSRVWAAFAATGIVLGAAYMLWLYQRTMFGELANPKNQKLGDLSLREVVVFAPIVVLCFWIGLYPRPFIEPMEKSIEKVVRAVNPSAVATTRPAMAPRIEEARKRFEAARLERLAATGSGHGHGQPAGSGE